MTILRSSKRTVLWASLFVVACGGEDANTGGRLQVTVSAEGLGANGYGFPPVAGQEVAFVDGWAVDFERILVAVDNLRLSSIPDRDPGDQSVTGKQVALRQGPFVLDLKQPGNAVDKGGAGKVAHLLPIDDLTGIFELEQRYAFSYTLATVTKEATFVNVDADDPDILAMIEGNQRVLLVGKATFKGTDCKSSDPPSDPPYDFDTLPKEVEFRMGLEGAVDYVNCQNPENTGAAIEGEESQRGIQMLPNGVTTAQITIHTDHLFWPTVAHEALPMFNQYAANATVDGDVGSVDLEALKSVPVPGVTDRSGHALPWRSCVAAGMYEMPPAPRTVFFDPSSQTLTNLHDFVEFNAATMGHLNADGLCYVAGVPGSNE